MANLYGPNVLTPELVPLNQTSSGSPYDPRVAELQQMLNSQGYTDPQGKPLAVDGMMGPLTQYALGQKSASTAQGLSASPEAGITYLGGTRAPPSVPTLPSGGMATPSTLAGFSPQIGQLLSTLQGRATAPLPAPESTPQYVAAKQQLQREGTEASTRAVQQMASRGVLRSSMTEGALQRIEQEIVDRLTTQILPQVQQQLMAERQTELGGLRGDLQTAIDLGKFDISQLSAAQQAGTQAQQFGIEQAYRNAQLQQKAQEFASGLRESQADREQRAALGFGGLNIQAQAQRLAQAKHDSDQDYRTWLKTKDVTAQQGETATQGYLSRILQFTNPKDAFDYLFNNAEAIVNDGANVSKILAQFRTKFPDFYRNTQLESLLERYASQQGE